MTKMRKIDLEYKYIQDKTTSTTPLKTTTEIITTESRHVMVDGIEKCKAPVSLTDFPLIRSFPTGFRSRD